MDDLLVRALVAGGGVAAVAGPTGCLLVWRRLAFFGDTLAHAALLGVALSLAYEINALLGVAVTSILLALLLTLSQRQRLVPPDTVLAVLSYTGLAAGVICVSLMQDVRVDLLSYLFGDILAVSGTDIAVILAGGGLVLAALAMLWRPALAVAVDEDLARTDGVPAATVNLGVVTVAAVVVAIAVKVVGILLVGALLIIPPACARRFARTPEQMALLAALLGVGAVAAGLAAAFVWDLPAGPAIVAAAAVTLLAVWLLPRSTTS